MDIYFGRIQALAQSDKLESRVRFALQVLPHNQTHDVQGQHCTEQAVHSSKLVACCVACRFLCLQGYVIKELEMRGHQGGNHDTGP